MSTRNDKCPGCGSGELDASSGVIVYVCGTTISQYGTNRSTTCHGIETATLLRRIAALIESGDALAEEAHPTMFCNEATTKRKVDAMDAWEKAKETKP